MVFLYGASWKNTSRINFKTCQPYVSIHTHAQEVKMTTTNVLKVGDKVSWRGSFGSADPVEVTVTRLEVTDVRRSKYGKNVNGVTWDLVKENRVNFGLSSGNWAYAEQIAPAGQDPDDYHGNT